jgi:hypothetical protein
MYQKFTENWRKFPHPTFYSALVFPIDRKFYLKICWRKGFNFLHVCGSHLSLCTHWHLTTWMTRLYKTMSTHKMSSLYLIRKWSIFHVKGEKQNMTHRKCDIHLKMWHPSKNVTYIWKCDIHLKEWHPSESMTSIWKHEVHLKVWHPSESVTSIWKCDVHLSVTSIWKCDIHLKAWRPSESVTSIWKCDIHPWHTD